MCVQFVSFVHALKTNNKIKSQKEKKRVTREFDSSPNESNARSSWINTHSHTHKHKHTHTHTHAHTHTHTHTHTLASPTERSFVLDLQLERVAGVAVHWPLRSHIGTCCMRISKEEKRCEWRSYTYYMKQTCASSRTLATLQSQWRL
jgi:ABC-type Zn2+ transport system substrate-binding protein/surface adhesin